VPDLIVVGSGIAGLFTALSAYQRGVRDVLIITKAALEESATRYAQGGIAAAVDDGDSWELHGADTMEAGAELCDPEAVRVLVGQARRQGGRSRSVGCPLRHREWAVSLRARGRPQLEVPL
jgi:aspartate oxidase